MAKEKTKTANSSETDKKEKYWLFKKGQSGNPSGRPPIDPRFTQLAKEKSISALQVVVEILENKEESSYDRLNAAKLVLSYGVGKPVETIDLNAEIQNALPQIVEIKVVKNATKETKH